MEEDELSIFGPHHIHPNGERERRRGRKREREREGEGGRAGERARERESVRESGRGINYNKKSQSASGLGATAARAHHTDSRMTGRPPKLCCGIVKALNQGNLKVHAVLQALQGVPEIRCGADSKVLLFPMFRRPWSL